MTNESVPIDRNVSAMPTDSILLTTTINFLYRERCVCPYQVVLGTRMHQLDCVKRFKKSILPRRVNKSLYLFELC